MVKVDKLPSNSWRARVHLGGGKYKTFTGKDKKDVQLRAAQFEAELEATKDTPPEQNMTIGEAMEKYVESKKNVLSPKTYREYVHMRENRLIELQKIPLYTLTQEQIQFAINDMAVGYSPKTVRNTHGLLSATIKMFRPELMLHTTLPQKEVSEIVIPTEEDMKALFMYTYNADIEIPILLAAINGMRMSEIIGLRWKMVDFDRHTLRVEAAKVRDIDNHMVMKVPKTHAGYRTIKLLPHVYNELKRLYKPDEEFVTSMPSNTIYVHYQSALKRCCPGKHYRFHDLRHYAASVMIMLGIPKKYIADYLGHETEDMVDRVYGHIMADKKDEMFARLDEYYEKIFAESVTKSVTK